MSKCTHEPLSQGKSSNRLPILQAEIRTAHAAAIAAAQTAVDRARDAGVRLIEAKELLGHGAWLPWLKETGISPRTAQDYMQLARIPEAKYATVAHLGIRKALAVIAKKRPVGAFRLPTSEEEVTRAEVGNLSALVWMSERYPGYFNVMTWEDHLSGLQPEASLQDIGELRTATVVSENGSAATITVLRKPIAGECVEYALKFMEFPDCASWETVWIGREGIDDLTICLEGGAK